MKKLPKNPQTKKTLTLKKAIFLDTELRDLQNETMSMKTKYNVRRTKKTIEDDVKGFYDLRKQLVEDLDVEQDPKTGVISGKEKAEFEKQLNEAVELKVKVTFYFAIDDLEEIVTDKAYFNILDTI